MGDGIGMLLLKEKQVRILSALMDRNREWHITDLAKETAVTYVHISKFVKKCEESGLIDSERHGRVKRLVLTDKGEDITRGALSMMEKLGLPDAKQQPQHTQK